MDLAGCRCFSFSRRGDSVLLYHSSTNAANRSAFDQGKGTIGAKGSRSAGKASSISTPDTLTQTIDNNNHSFGHYRSSDYDLLPPYPVRLCLALGGMDSSWLSYAKQSHCYLSSNSTCYSSSGTGSSQHHLLDLHADRLSVSGLSGVRHINNVR